MFHPYPYNPFTNNEKLTNRLIFFADRKETRKASTREAVPRLITPEQERQLKELEAMPQTTFAKEIAQQYRAGNIETETFEEAREVLRDPNKMEKDPYRHFMKALARGKFPNKAKHARQFLRALKGFDKERAYAKDILKIVSEDTEGQLSERKEKAYLKELAALRKEELAQRTVKEIGAKVSTITSAADTREAVRAASETSETNWRIENAPDDLIKTLDRLEIEQAEIAKKANEKDQQLEQALAEDKPNEILIAKLKKEIQDLDRQFDALAEKLQEPQKEFQNYLIRNLARYEALEAFLDRAGIDFSTAKKLKMWFLKLSGRNESSDAKTSLKMEGVVIDPETGATKKQEAIIEITGIRFERDRSDLEPGSPGELIIEYINERGEPSYANYKIFLQMIHAFEAYEDLESLAEVNKKLAEEMGYIELAEGQEFETSVVVGLSDQGKEVREPAKFKIQRIDNQKKKIILDHTVTKIPRQWITFSVHPTLYFDRKQREFNFGEFVKFVKQHGYARDIPISEAESAIDGAHTSLQEECAEFVTGRSTQVKERYQRIGGIPDDSTKLKVPTKVGDSTKVVFLDEYRQRRLGTLEREIDDDGKETFALDVDNSKTLAATGTDDLEALTAAGVPLSMAVAKPGSGRWKKKKLNTRALLQMANKDQLSHISESGLDTPSSRPATEENILTEKEIEERQKEIEQSKATGQPSSQKLYQEALPYDVVHKTGGFELKKKSFIKALWADTRILSVNDFWEMGKAMWEYYNRRFRRKQKDKYSAIGVELPFFAPEMRRINQTAETEQVNQFKESFEQKGVFEIQDRLVKTHTRDEMKACFIALAAKGQLRWDDIDLWKNLNHFVKADLAIPIPGNGDPYTRQSETDHRTGFDYLKAAIDSLWGEGQYNDWFRQNKSTFQSNARGYYEEGKEMEGVDGGHAKRLGVLLQQHRNGEFVDPQEYEGLILHAIEFGKARMQAKVYYMIMGVAATNSKGKTILSFDRMAHFNSEMLIRFPLLEYLCASVPRPDGKGSHRYTLDDYKQWSRWFDQDSDSRELGKPGRMVDKFLWDFVLPSDETQNRINKAIRNGEQLDHDDMFAYLPPATEEVVTDACKATTGSKKFLTIEGYANAFPGFSQYMSSLAEKNNRNKLREAIKSYVRYEGIIRNRFEKEKDIYQRMSYATLNSATIVSNTPPQAFIDQMNPMIQQVIDAYDDPELNELFKLTRIETGDIFSDPNQRDLQNKINHAFRQFSNVFTRVIKSDNGEKMIAIVNSTPLEGLPFGVSDEEQAKRKAAYSDQFAL